MNDKKIFFTLLDANDDNKFINDFFLDSEGEKIFSENYNDYLNLINFPVSSKILKTPTKSLKNGEAVTVSSYGSTDGLSTNVFPIRPMISRDNFFDFENLFNDDNFFEFGEYPQKVASKSVSSLLSELDNLNKLVKTGKCYTEFFKKNPFSTVREYDEFFFEGKKYIKLLSGGNIKFDNDLKNSLISNDLGITLSNNNTYMQGDCVWIEVLPIKWFVHKNSKTILSVDPLFFHSFFYNHDNVSNSFNDSDLFNFLNSTFANDIKPSSCVKIFNCEYQTLCSVNTNDVTEEEIIEGAILCDITVFLHGASSDGKSARVKALDPDCEIIYLAASTPESLFGKSVYQSSTSNMIDIKPSWLISLEKKCASDPDNIHILFLDELSNAMPAIQKYAFNLVLDKEVNGKWKLPDNCRIVCAGNEVSDSLAASELAEPLFNRCAHVYIKTFASNWLLWAANNNIHPAIYAYISWKKDEVLRTRYDGVEPNADPRKWELASKLLYKTGKVHMLRGLIGEPLTNELAAFCKVPLFKLADVLSGNIDRSKVSILNVSDKYALVLALISVDEDNFSTVRDFVILLGFEFLSLFETLWSLNDTDRLEIVMEEKLSDEMRMV